MNDIASSLARVREAIAAAARDSGRRPEDIQLIAVSKTHPIASLQAAMAAGQRVFGESTTQEALPKISQLGSREIEWHFTGHLQSNKAKFLPGNFSWLHSLDSAKLAQRLSHLALEKHVVLNVLIEVNLGNDPNKHGITRADVFPLIEQVQRENFTGFVLRGLMTIAPHPAEEPEIRRTYAALRDLRDRCVNHFGLTAFTELSMGMSGDYIAAIKEGATMVRIGTAIFGERDYAVS